MAVEVRAFDASLAGEVVEVFNRETDAEPYVVPLTDGMFRDLVWSKPYFRPEGCFVATDGGRAVGFALTSAGIHWGRENVRPGVRAVDGLFFPRGRLEVGTVLLDACLAYFRACGGVETVYGFASGGGYPFWRGIYCGTEPVCLTHYSHAWATFMARGFTHHQQSLNYLGTPLPTVGREDLDYEETDLEIEGEWGRDSWRGHRPRVLRSALNSRCVGQIGYAELPYLSAYRNKRVAGIYSMGVNEAFRRQGIGASTIGALFTRLHEQGYAEVLVGTTVENTAARKTYEKAGMEPIAFRTGTVLRAEGTGQRAQREQRT